MMDDLPLPLRPHIATFSPGLMASFRSCNAKDCESLSSFLLIALLSCARSLETDDLGGVSSQSLRNTLF